MKQRTRARSSGLFLLELIIAILFFTAASAVCVQFFVKSHTMSQDSAELNFAVNECSSIAEIVQTSGSEKAAFEALETAYPEAVFSDSKSGETPDEILVYFDEKMNACTASDKGIAYSVSADFASEDGLLECHVSAEKAGQKSDQSDSKIVIYELDLKHALQEVND